jgi:PmbA protein
LINTFIHAISGSNLYRKHSFLLDKIGHSVFPKWMHIHEKPHIKRGLGSSPIDGDGVPTRENTFVENGILQQYVLGTYSARRLGLQTTANAGGVHNLIVTPNMHSESNMIQEMDKGLFVTELMGQGVNILTGDYSRGAAGYWIEDGKIQYPVDGITIAGHLQDMFKGIVGIGDNVNPNFAAQVGSIWIDRMTIAGSES